MAGKAQGPRIERLRVAAYRVPTDAPEADGTASWEATTVVVVELDAAGATGLGYTYGHQAVGLVVEELFAPLVVGSSAFDNAATWVQLMQRSRNIGRPGLVSMAIAAVDSALWDLKAKILQLPLATLLGPLRQSVAIYGSGGFTSYSDRRLAEQLGGWVSQGIPRVKMKVGTEPRRDVERVRLAREAVGAQAELFVDANGAYSRKQALRLSESFAGAGVSWFEEPVSMEDHEGLRLIRDRGPAGMDIAAGEYGFDLVDFRWLLQSGAVDVLQADVTRCAGITGFLRVAALCDVWGLPLSGHCAPALHLHPACAAPRLRHLEWFHDHVRLERLFFEGCPVPQAGEIAPDLSHPGHGLVLKRADVERFRI